MGLALVQGLARGMTSPLREMAAAASAMARGDYERRVTASSRDEVGELARAFNAMAADLADVERMRRDLVANVSHELRTPISALRAVLENLADGVAPADPEAIEVALAQTQRLGRLVEQLLDLSRLESGAVPLAPERFAVHALLDRAARECALGERVVRLRIEVDPIDLEATAIRSGSSRSWPTCSTTPSATRRRRGACRSVAYNGGRPPRSRSRTTGPASAAEAQRVFERFYRTDAARSSQGRRQRARARDRALDRRRPRGSIRAEQRPDRPGARIVVELPR